MFMPMQSVETPEGNGVVKYTKVNSNNEVDRVVCEVDGKEVEYSPDSVRTLESEPETQRNPKPKQIRINIQFQHTDGSLLPKDQFLALMGQEYDRIVQELGGTDEEIDKIVQASYDEHPGANFNLQYLQSRVMKALPPTDVDAWKKLDKRFKVYMDRHVGTKESGALYGVKLGKGGGHFRWSDQKA